MKNTIPISFQKYLEELALELSYRFRPFFVIATDSRRTRKLVAQALKDRLIDSSIEELILDELSPSLPKILEMYKGRNVQIAFIYGINELPQKERCEILERINFAREGLASYKIPLVIFGVHKIIQWMQDHARDFWSWCGPRIYKFSSSIQTIENGQKIEALELQNLVERSEKYKAQLEGPGLSEGTRKVILERLNELEREITALQIRLEAGSASLLQQIWDYSKDRLSFLLEVNKEVTSKKPLMVTLGVLLKELTINAAEAGGIEDVLSFAYALGGNEIAGVVRSVYEGKSSAYEEVNQRLSYQDFMEQAKRFMDNTGGLQLATLACMEKDALKALDVMFTQAEEKLGTLPEKTMEFIQKIRELGFFSKEQVNKYALRQAKELAQRFCSELITVQKNLEEFRKIYNKHIINRFEYMDFRGIMQVITLQPFRLKDLYIPLSLQPLAYGMPYSKERPWRFVEGPFGEYSGYISRGELDEPKQLSLPLESESQALAYQKGPGKPLPIKEVLEKKSQMVFLGDPGSGKSTLIKFIALTLASNGSSAIKEIGIKGLPVVMSVSLYAEALRQEGDLNLLDFLVKYYSQAGLSGIGDLIKTDIEQGHCVFLLDGLDEISWIEGRRQVREKIKEFADFYASEEKGNRIIVTSRIAGYEEAPLSGFNHCMIASLEPEDIREFTKRWCIAFEKVSSTDPDREKKAIEEAESLWEAIKSKDSLMELAKRPLLLTILALIRRQGTTLPNRRVELYERYIEALAETWNRARSLLGRPINLFLGGRPIDAQMISSILAPVAFWMHENEPTGLIRKDKLKEQLVNPHRMEFRVDWKEVEKLRDHFLELIKVHSGLMLERGVDLYAFAHRTFQEYLAALYLTEMADAKDFVRSRLHNPHWREVILIYQSQGKEV